MERYPRQITQSLFQTVLHKDVLPLLDLLSAITKNPQRMVDLRWNTPRIIFVLIYGLYLFHCVNGSQNWTNYIEEVADTRISLNSLRVLCYAQCYAKCHDAQVSQIVY